MKVFGEMLDFAGVVAMMGLISLGLLPIDERVFRVVKDLKHKTGRMRNA